MDDSSRTSIEAKSELAKEVIKQKRAPSLTHNPTCVLNLEQRTAHTNRKQIYIHIN